MLASLVAGTKYEESELLKQIEIEKAEYMLKRHPGDFFTSFVKYSREYGNKELLKDKKILGNLLALDDIANFH